MKSTGTLQAGSGFWQEPNTDATNSSGFAALPAGNRAYLGSFFNLGKYTFWWSSTESSTETGWNRHLKYNSGGSFRYNGEKAFGFSVRCLRD
jgi:uncharacterized protein (TIGR02145 family)